VATGGEDDGAEWLLLGPDQWARWEESNLLDGKERLLRWDAEPPDAEVRALRVVTASGDPTSLPPMVTQLTGLTKLELPRGCVRRVAPGDLPSSLASLRLTGPGRVSWPRKVVLDGVRRLESIGGDLAATAESFPGVVGLTLRMDSKGDAVRLVGEYPGLQELGAANVNTDEVIEAAPDGLRVLAVSGGRLASVTAVARLSELTRLVVNNCAALTSIDGVQHLSKLEGLVVAYCEGLTDLALVAELPALRTVRVTGCRGLDRAALSALFGGIDLYVVG
jgi:hypothetical protein